MNYMHVLQTKRKRILTPIQSSFFTQIFSRIKTYNICKAQGAYILSKKKNK